MSSFNSRVIPFVTLLAFALTGCGGASGSGAAAMPFITSITDRSAAAPNDTTSILKKLTKDVTIGSTVDPGNGDKGPRALAIAQSSFGKMKTGQALVCNFEDKSGKAGMGTTIDLFDAKAGSKPSTFIQSSDIQGCSGDALAGGDDMYATGSSSNLFVEILPSAKVKKTWPMTAPIAGTDAPPIYEYSPEYTFMGTSGGIVYNYSFGLYGDKKVTGIISGFPASGSGWSAEGPSGLAYWCGAPPGAFKCKNRVDTLYVADGACNAIVSINNASELLVKDEIVVGAGCKTFKCLYKKFSCGKVIKAGSPLDVPFAATMLPNGNLVVANTKGGNTLVELTPAGQVLATKVVDKSKTAGIYALAYGGTSDNNAVLFYTDTNTNTLHELEQ
jgi:hypothetical protein